MKFITIILASTLVSTAGFGSSENRENREDRTEPEISLNCSATHWVGTEEDGGWESAHSESIRIEKNGDASIEFDVILSGVKVAVESQGYWRQEEREEPFPYLSNALNVRMAVKMPEKELETVQFDNRFFDAESFYARGGGPDVNAGYAAKLGENVEDTWSLSCSVSRYMR